MTGFVFHKDYLKHNPGIFGHPERRERLNVILNTFEKFSAADNVILHRPQPAQENQIALAHSTEYIEEMVEFCRKGGYHHSMESELNSDSHNAALLAVGGGIEACDKVLEGEWVNAFCAVRPPGHHATINRAMGFCMFNNIAIAAAYLLKQGVEGVLIVDWDVHHGNGTQNIFYDSNRVFFYSTHQRNLYPFGSGQEEQTGEGQGIGFTLNRPLTPGTSGDEHVSIIKKDLDKITEDFNPGFALISCGFDSCKGDLLGSLNLEDEHYAEMTKAVGEVAGGKVVSFLEGGYDLNLLGGCFGAHFEALVNLAEG